LKISQEKMNDRINSWNRMDSNIRSDTLRQAGVPEDFIDPVRRLDFWEIESNYPEIAEWLIETQGLFNESPFESSLDEWQKKTQNISINDPNQYWDLTDIIGERKASEYLLPEAIDDEIDHHPSGVAFTCNLCGEDLADDDNGDGDIRPEDKDSILAHFRDQHGITESYSTEDDKSDWVLNTGLPHVKYDADNPIPEDMLGQAFKLANQTDREGLECPRCHEKTMFMLILPEMLCSNCGLRYSLESFAKEILGFDELQTEDLTYEEIVELTKGIPIDEIPEKLRHAGMKLQFDKDFKAGDNPYVGNWENFSKERELYLPDHFDLDEQRLEDIDDGYATADLIKCNICGMKFDLEDSNGERDAIRHLKDHNITESGFNFEDIVEGEPMKETGKLRERFPRGFVNFNKKREEEIQQEIRDAGGIDGIIARSQVKPIDSYQDWLRKNAKNNSWNKIGREGSSQIDILYAEKESIEQEINQLENDSIRIGLVGSDQELIAIDDEIIKKQQELENIEKEIDNFAGETDWKQFTKDFFLHQEDDIHDLLERQRNNDKNLKDYIRKEQVESTDSEEEKKFLDDYGKNVNWDESSFWDLFKDNTKEVDLWDNNDYNKYKQKFLKKYPNSTEDDFKKQIQGSDYYSKEELNWSRQRPLNDIEKEIYLKRDGDDRYFWERDLGSSDPFNPNKKSDDESKSNEGWEVEEELYQQLLDGEIGWHELTPEMKADINNYIEKNNLSVETKSTEGGYGSGKNRHGFGHKKWMKDAEINDSIIKSEDMNKDAIPLEEYTYHSRKETDHHKSNPEIRRLKDRIRKLERQLDDE